MSRLQQILSGVLVLQIALAAYLLWPSQASAEAVPLFEGYEAQNVETVTIEDVDGNSVELSRTDDGWVLASGGNFPADGEKIEPILENIGEANTRRLVTRTEASHARLSVAQDDFLRRMTLEMADGESLEFYVGTVTGGTSAHIRKAGEDEVYLAYEMPYYRLGVRPTDWIDAIYVSVPQDNLLTLSFENEQGTFAFEKTEEGAWVYPELSEDLNFAENNLRSMLNTISSLRMVKPLGQEELPEYGMDNPSASIEYSYTDEEGAHKTATLLIGSQLEEEQNNYVIKSSESPYYVLASQGVVGNYVTRTQADFILPDPTATPAETSTP